MVELKDRIASAMREIGRDPERYGSASWLAVVLEISPTGAKKLLSGASRSMKPVTAANAVKALGRTLEWWLMQDSGDAPHDLADSRGVAHPLSPRPTKVASRITWEQLLKGEHTEEFIVALPDDAMAPRAMAGTELIFDTRRPPVFGSWVIVKNANGTPFVRQYRESTADEWEAYAFNEGYRTMYPIRDGLTIVACMVGVMRSSL